MVWLAERFTLSARCWRTALLSALGRRDSRFGLQWEMSKILKFRETPLMYESLRLVITAMVSYPIDGLAGRALRIERVSLANGPSEPPRAA